MLSEYKEVFMEEFQELLQIMDEEILKLEQEGDSAPIIQTLFRAAHTLKGSSAAMGFKEMKDLTHEMEHLLEQVRNGDLGISESLTDLLFKSLDCLKQLKSDIEHNKPSTVDISAMIKELRSFAMKEPAFQTMSDFHKLSLGLDMRLKMEEAWDRGLKVYWINMRISAECALKGARAVVIHSNLCEWGTVLFTTPDLEKIDEQSDIPLDVAFLYAGNQSSSEMKTLVSDLTEVTDFRVEPLEMTDAIPVHPKEEAQQNKIAETRPQPNNFKSPTVRVSVERLEQLMNLVGELVIDQTRIQQVMRIQSRIFSHESVDELGVISDHLSRIIGDLQESVMKARMLPIEQLFNRFPRMVRDLSRSLGKELEFVMEGKDTELDRTLIEEIADPLIHLIRNAIDHGIETPEARRKSGKNNKGTIRIRAAHEDNQVMIYVEDDGAGIDPEKMKQSALKKGIITSTQAEQMTDKEAIELIFRPGFSTAQAVSDISGRGVGMDIVKSHIQKLNGLIDIETSLGKGTRFIVKLPLTLAIIVGLLVKLHKQTYIIPMSNITEIVRATYEDILTVQGKSVIMLRNQVIPVTWLHDRFRLPRPMNKNNRIPLVIVGAAEKRLALAVDELIGNQEIVIKSLGSYIGKIDCIAGATILGDGKVALILEIPGIVNSSV